MYIMIALQPGRFILIADASNLRYSMARYYDFFIDENPSQEATVSFPYLDAFGLGNYINNYIFYIYWIMNIFFTSESVLAMLTTI